MNTFRLTVMLLGFALNASADNTNPPNWTPPTAASVWDKAAYTQPTKAPTNTAPVIQPLQFPQASLQGAAAPSVDLSPLRGEFALGPVGQGQSPDQANLLAVASGQSREAQYVRDHTSFMDAFRASYDNEMRPLVNAISRMFDTPLGVDPRDEAWLKESRTDWKKTFAGYSSDERDNLLEAVNKKDFDRRVEQIKMQRDNAETFQLAGPTHSFIAKTLAFVLNPVNAIVILFVIALVKRRIKKAVSLQTLS